MNSSAKSQGSSPSRGSRPPITASGEGVAQAIQYNEEGNEFFELGNYRDAIRLFEKAIETRQDIAISHSYKGAALESLGEYESARDSFDIALALDPKLVEAHIGKGTSLLALLKEEVYQNGVEFTDIESKQATIVECFNTAIKISPKTLIAYRQKGALFQFLGKYQQAVQWYDQALILKRYDLNTWIQKGACLQSQGKYNEANQCFEIAISLESENPVVKRAKKTLVQLCHEKKFELLEEAKIDLDEVQIGSVKLYSSKSVEECNPNLEGSFRQSRDSGYLSKSQENRSVDQFNFNLGISKDVHDFPPGSSLKNQMQESGKNKALNQNLSVHDRAFHIDKSGESSKFVQGGSGKLRKDLENKSQAEDQYNLNFGISKDVYDNSYKGSYKHQLKESQEGQVPNRDQEDKKQEEDELQKSQFSLSWNAEEDKKGLQDHSDYDYNKSQNNEIENSGRSIHIKQMHEPRLLKEESNNLEKVGLDSRNSSGTNLSTRSLHASSNPYDFNADLKGSLSSSHYKEGMPRLDYEKLDGSLDPSLMKKIEMKESGGETKRESEISSSVDMIASVNANSVKKRMNEVRERMLKRLAGTDRAYTILKGKSKEIQHKSDKNEIIQLEKECRVSLLKMKGRGAKISKDVVRYMNQRWRGILEEQGWKKQEIQNSLRYLESFLSIFTSAYKISQAIVKGQVCLDNQDDIADVLSALISLQMLDSNVFDIESYLNSDSFREKAEKVVKVDLDLSGVEKFAREVAEKILLESKIKDAFQEKFSGQTADQQFYEIEKKLIPFCKNLKDNDDFKPSLHTSKYETQSRRMAHRDANTLFKDLLDNEDQSMSIALIISQYD